MIKEHLKQIPPELFSTVYNNMGRTLCHDLLINQNFHEIYYGPDIDLHPKTNASNQSPGRTPLSILLHLQLRHYRKFHSQVENYSIHLSFRRLIAHLIHNTNPYLFWRDNPTLKSQITNNPVIIPQVNEISDVSYFFG